MRQEARLRKSKFSKNQIISILKPVEAKTFVESMRKAVVPATRTLFTFEAATRHRRHQLGAVLPTLPTVTLPKALPKRLPQEQQEVAFSGSQDCLQR